MRSSFLILLIAFLISCSAHAQSVIIILAPVDGVDINADNALSFQVQSAFKGSTNALVKGLIRFRNSDMRISYQFQTTLQPGINSFSKDAVHPTWNFSSSALRELFTEYKILPQGTYEYCVTVDPDYHSGEGVQGAEETECLYRQSEDLFSINLVDPENDAKLYEYNPMLSWIANYPFASALTYRVRVAEIKKGQNPANAISRNNPVYQEKNIMQNSIVYPVYAKPLETWQPYAWTVDAYYKGILLGGAETWKFTIVEDSLLIASIPKVVSYFDFKAHYGESYIYAIGKIKLKYVNDQQDNTLSFKITGQNQEKTLDSISLKPGENMLDLDVSGKGLKHLKTYNILVRDNNSKTYNIPFIYVNPEYLK